jgi:pyruvate formate lyase activating enzyme
MRLAGYAPFSLSDYPGKPAAVVFTQGCNFRCPFCHNRQLIRGPRAGIPGLPDSFVFEHLRRRQGRLGGVTVSGGEPTLQDDLEEFCRELQGLGLAVKLDTNGSRPEVLGRLLQAGVVDYVAMDVKAPLESYRRLAGVEVVPMAIAASVDTIARSGVAHLFRTTQVPGLVSPEDIERIRTLIPIGSEHRLQAYRTPPGRWTQRPRPPGERAKPSPPDLISISHSNGEPDQRRLELS